MSSALVEALQRRLRPLEDRLQSAHLVGIGARLRNDFAFDGGKIDTQNPPVPYDLAPCNMQRFDVLGGCTGQHNLQRLNHSAVQAMPKQGDQGLCARVDAPMLATESQFPAVIQKRPGREFTQDGFRQRK